MRLRIGVMIAAALLAVPAALGATDTDRLERKSQPITAEALSAIRDSEPTRALTLVEPLLADFEKAYAGKSRIYCAETVKESAMYLLTPGSDGGESLQAADPDAPKDDAKGANIILNSGWCKAQYVRAFALVDVGRLDEAQAGFERLVRFAPRRSRYLSELGFLFQKKKQWQASLDLYTRADVAADLLEPADRDYERCVALRGQGYDLVEMGRLDDAERAYRKCLAITPGEPKSLNEIDYINEQRRKTT